MEVRSPCGSSEPHELFALELDVDRSVKLSEQNLNRQGWFSIYIYIQKTLRAAMGRGPREQRKTNKEAKFECHREGTLANGADACRAVESVLPEERSGANSTLHSGDSSC